MKETSAADVQNRPRSRSISAASVTVMLGKLRDLVAADHEAVELLVSSKARLLTAPAVKLNIAARQGDATMPTWEREEVASTVDEVTFMTIQGLTCRDNEGRPCGAERAGRSTR